MKRITIFPYIFLLGVFATDMISAKTGKIKFNNGDIYKGSYLRRYKGYNIYFKTYTKIPDGSGIMYYSNGDTFDGVWVDGKPRLGTYTYTDGSTFVGEISVLNKWKGTLTFKNNDNIAEGFDSWLIKAGNKFSGEVRPFSKILVDGEFSDEITNTKGDTFCGRIMSGKPSNGKFYYADTSRVKQWIIPAGCTFNGDIKSFSGTVNSIIISADGVKYIGQLKDGKPDGTGELLTADGDRYTGYLKDGKPDGKGELLTAAGDRYTGNFSAGVLHGEGTVVFADGRTETGEWRNGQSPSEYDKMCLVKFDEHFKKEKEERRRKDLLYDFVMYFSDKFIHIPAQAIPATPDEEYGASLRLKQMFCGKKFIRLKDDVSLFGSYENKEEKIYECIDITDDKITLKSESGEVIRRSIFSFYVKSKPDKKLSEYIPYPEDLEGVYQYYELYVYNPSVEKENFSIYPLADRELSRKRTTDFFIKKYGYVYGMAVANKKANLGMTIEMIEDMFGYGRQSSYLSGNTEIVTITYGGGLFKSSTKYEFINNKLTSIYSY